MCTTALSLSTRLVFEEFAGDYEGPLYAPHPDLKERRAELGLSTPVPVRDNTLKAGAVRGDG